MSDLPSNGREDSVAAARGEVLVVIMNNMFDFSVARDHRWYRIPVRSAKRLKERWPPRWLAFYQTKAFGPERYSVNYYAPVRGISVATRRELLPEDAGHSRADERYYRIEIGELQRLPRPILSRRLRRIVFVPTTWDKFISAVEINDLYDESPLEDRLWAQFKRHEIRAERQYFVKVRANRYALDFAVFCQRGQIDVETDGDSWHADPPRISLDNQRDNDLTGAGWSILRFNGQQIRDQAAQYCIPAVMRTMNRLGGLTTDGLIALQFDPDDPEGPHQLALFESGPEYDVDSW